MKELLNCSVAKIDSIVSPIARQWKKSKTLVCDLLSEWHLNVVECEPQIRTIRIFQYNTTSFERRASSSLETYSLPFPYMQFALLEFDRNKRCYYVSMTPHPLEDPIENWGSRVPLPNIGSQGGVCLGGEKPKILDEAIGLFWMTFFDDTPWHHWCGTKELESKFAFGFETWEKYTVDEICEMDMERTLNLKKFTVDVWQGSDTRCGMFLDFPNSERRGE